ncbi:MAG TPA: hypothetical protein VHO70_19895 [Chitinispirillaceae bacterium]|nr:hypothetical protein [Chitinispirillaceae bacterium]
MSEMISNSQLAEAYVEHGGKYGFFSAECILLQHLPDHKLDGVCADVPPENREAFLLELQSGMFEMISGSIEPLSENEAEHAN